MAELTLGSLNLHMGRGTGGHDAPFYDVVTACKEIDTDVLVLQEGWVPDDAEGDVLAVADALGYQVAGTFAVARATCHDQVRLVAREGAEGDGDWVVAVLSRLPVRSADVVRVGPQLRRDPGRRAVVRAVVDVDGTAVHRRRHPHAPAEGPRVAAGARHPRRPARPRRARGLRRRHEHVGLVRRPAGRSGLAPRRCGAARIRPTGRTARPTTSWSTPPVEVVSSEVVRQVMSDHRPVRARLRFCPSPAPPSPPRHGRPVRRSDGRTRRRHAAARRRVELVQAGDRAAARVRYQGIWDEIGPDGDPLHRCAVAHSMADVQDDPRDELVWDTRALEAAELLTDERVAAAGIAGSARSFEPSLHLNLADVHLRLGHRDQAAHHVAAGAASLDALAEDGYRR